MNSEEFIMEGKATTSIENLKYRRARRRKEAVAAWLFLLPNFIGFLIITFLPIFATFILSFTEWDGKSRASAASVVISINTEKPVSQDITIPEDAVLVYVQREADKRERSITVPYILNEDIVIPVDAAQTYGFVDSIAFKQWSSCIGENGQPILSPVPADQLPEIVVKYDLNLDPDEYPYLVESQLFYGEEARTLAPRLAESIYGISKNLVIDNNNVGKEIGFSINVGVTNQIVVPAGTIIIVDLLIQKIVAIETNDFNFPLGREVVRNEVIPIRSPLVIKAGKTASQSIEVRASRTGEINSLYNKAKVLLEWKQRITTLTPGSVDYRDAEKIITTLRKEIAAMVQIENADLPEDYYVDFQFIKDKGNNGFHFVGIKNFKNLILTDSRFGDYLKNTLVFLIEIPLGMAISLIMALAMNQPLKGIVVFRVLYFLPNISNLVAVALLWQWILNPDYGFLNQGLRAIGIQNPPQWFANKAWAKVAIMIVDVWKGAGYNMMLYLAGLQGIPHDYYEAAEIDGASAMQQFWKITWPLLGPTHFFILIMGVIGGFQAFGTQYIMTGGGPSGSTTTIVFYIYNNAYRWGKMGYATAIAVVLFFFVMVITIINWRVSEGNVEY